MLSSDRPSRPDPALIARLNDAIRRLGGQGLRPNAAPAVLPLNLEAIDAALPWGGLPRGGLHEVAAADASAAAVGFSAVLLARFADRSGVVVWCRRRPDGPYGPGLAAFGLDAARLIVVRARTETDAFWAMEEGLRSGAVAAVLGEVASHRPIALRRLQLAAERAGTTALLLRPFGSAVGSSPAVTRWRVWSAPSVATDDPSAALRGHRVRCRWHVELLRFRVGVLACGDASRPPGTLPGSARWLLEWHDETGALAVAAALRHRPAEPRVAAVAGV